jgi:hypothetical protein
MPRDDYSDLTESKYLDPVQLRAERLALANPFLGQESGFGPLGEQSIRNQIAYEDRLAQLPNALARPPVDISGLSLDKQMAWQDRLAQEETHVLDIETKRRQREEADIRRKEGLELVRRSADLNPTSPDYHVKKNALIRQFPGGATSPEAQAILTGLDERRKVVETAEQEEKKAAASTERARGENNFNAARTEASNLGPEFLGNFLEISKAQGPDAAIAYVGREGARTKEAGLRTQLKEGGGMTEEEITARYGGEQIPFRTTPFQFPAAEARVKGGATERRQAQLAYSNLMAAKAKAKHPLTGEIQPEQWGDAEEGRLAAAAAELDALTGRPIGQTATTTTTPAARPAATPAARPTVMTISATDAAAKMGRPVSPGTTFTDKYGNRIVVQ